MALMPPSKAGKAAPTRFEKLTASQTGIDFVHQWAPRDDYEKALLKTGFTGGGVCVGDYDNDGLCDIYFTRPHGGGRLYRNLGGFRFVDATLAAGVSTDDSWTTGATFVDVNNDGWIDLYVCAYASASYLFLNDGKGRFSDVTDSAGLGFRGANVKMLFADYDRDGDLDAYLVTNRLEPRQPVKIKYEGGPVTYTVAKEHEELAGVINLPNGKQQFVKAGQFDHFFKNKFQETGQLRFTDVSQNVGIGGNYHGLDAIWWDFNADGFPDLYVANDFTDPDQFYRNNGDGTFTDVVGEALPNTPWFTMGAAVGDFNNDGLFDLMATDMAGTTHYREKIAMGSMDAIAWFLDTAEPRQYMRNSLFLNSGTDRFIEIAHLAGVAQSDWTWSVKVADFDNDGHEDIFVTNGFTRDYLNSDFNEQLRKTGQQSSLAWYDAPVLRERNIMFRNEGNYHFEDVSAEWGFDELGISFGAATADLDNDGDLDLLVSDFAAPPTVYRNNSSESRRIKVQLVGDRSNSLGLGSTVQIVAGKNTCLQYVDLGGGFMSADTNEVFSGLGSETTIDRLTVRWPSGVEQTLHDLPVDHAFEIHEPSHGEAQEPRPKPSTKTVYSDTDLLGIARHSERPFDDFAVQPLLPNKLSQLGPGIAWSDVDNDGDDDLYLAGAAGQAGQLFMCLSAGNYTATNVAALEADAACEDLGALFLDYDADGDWDLYVVSGSNEYEPGDPRLRDRLYRNEGPTNQGVKWSKAVDALPDVADSGGVVAAADVDRDGDLDLFVGGRAVPGAYPTMPASRLLRNDRGQFVDASSTIAPDLATAGMVTGAIWSDANNDGWIDLLLTTEFGPVRFFRNDSGQLVEATAESKIHRLTGWWNGIAAADIDLDGDVDYAVTNFGHNTKYHPTMDRPHTVFYGDFAGDGRQRIVEAKPGSTGLLPVRGRSCSSNAMPFLKQKFETYHAFASASLQEIYTEQCLQDALRLHVNTLASGVLVNDGQAHFVFRPLPVLAQVAPAFGVQFTLVNDDPFPDLVLAQNFYSPQRETGRMAGGLGLALLGNGDGTFEPLWPYESGIVVPGDATAVSTVDLNHDGWPDLQVALNDGPIKSYLRSETSGHAPLAIKLRGRAGNPSGVGARVEIITAQEQTQLAELTAGHGYLTQSPAKIHFYARKDDPPVAAFVRWPNGDASRHMLESGMTEIELIQPK